MAPPTASSSDRIPLLAQDAAAGPASGEESSRWYRRTASLAAGALVGMLVVAAVLGSDVKFKAGIHLLAGLGQQPQQQPEGQPAVTTAAAAATNPNPNPKLEPEPAVAAPTAATCAPVRDFSESACAKIYSQRTAQDSDDNLLERYSACIHGLGDFPKSQPYAIAGGKKQQQQQQGESRARVQPGDAPFAYSFVHIPKTGGSTVAVRFNFLARQSGGCVRREDEPSRFAASYPVDPQHPMFPARCVIDTSTPAFSHTLDALAFKQAPEFTPAAIARAHNAGNRAWIKGMFSMGTCDLVDGPCAYVTVLRHPVERLLSHYKYICLQGSENHEG